MQRTETGSVEWPLSGAGTVDSSCRLTADSVASYTGDVNRNTELCIRRADLSDDRVHRRTVNHWFTKQQ